MYPMSMVQKYWDTKNEPVSTRHGHGINNLTVWPISVCHNICAFVLRPLVSLSVAVYRCFLMFSVRRLLHQKKQLHRFVVPEKWKYVSEYLSIIPSIYISKHGHYFEQMQTSLFQNLSLKPGFLSNFWFTHMTATQTNNAFWKGIFPQKLP